MSKETFTTVLEEQRADAQPKSIKVNILSEAGKLWIQPQGYGDKTSANGHGYLVSMEICQGRLRLIAFNDINTEDPQIIDLENARESGRIQKD